MAMEESKQIYITSEDIKKASKEENKKNKTASYEKEKGVKLFCSIFDVQDIKDIAPQIMSISDSIIQDYIDDFYYDEFIRHEACFNKLSCIKLRTLIALYCSAMASDTGTIDSGSSQGAVVSERVTAGQTTWDKKYSTSTKQTVATKTWRDKYKASIQEYCQEAKTTSTGNLIVISNGGC